jgi:hypothetical protein
MIQKILIKKCFIICESAGFWLLLFVLHHEIQKSNLTKYIIDPKSIIIMIIFILLRKKFHP